MNVRRGKSGHPLAGQLARLLGVVVLLVATLLLNRPAVSVEAGYILGPGDKVRVTVFGQEDLSGEFEVDAAGSIALPLIQAVPAQGLTPQQVEKEIASRLEPDFLRNPKVSVEVLTYRPFYIYGEVLRPGGYPYVNGMTVHNAIALAGGFTYRARTSSVIIRRTQGGTVSEQQSDLNTAIVPGDVIEVRERYF